jgi:hypothetical protein
MAGDVAAALRGAPPESDGSRICGAGRGAAPTGEGRIHARPFSIARRADSGVPLAAS